MSITNRKPNEADNNSIKNDNNQPASLEKTSSEGVSNLSYADFAMILNLFPDLFHKNPFPLLHNVTLPVDLNLINLQLAALQIENDINNIDVGKQSATPDVKFYEYSLYSWQKATLAYLDQEKAPLENATHNFVLTEYSSSSIAISLSDHYDDFAFTSATINTPDILFNFLNQHETSLRGGENDTAGAGEEAAPEFVPVEVVPVIGPEGTIPLTTGIGGTITPEIPLPPSNTPPEAGDSSINGDANVSYIFALSDFVFSDSDVGDEVETLKFESLPNDGVLEIYNGISWELVGAGDEIAISVIEDGHLRFTGDIHEFGQNYASFNFSVSDGTDPSNIATVTINLAPPPNTPPEAGDSSVSGTEDVSYIFALSDFNFSDNDFGDAVETLKFESIPNNGMLEIYNGITWELVGAGDEIALSVIDDSHLRFTGYLHEAGDDNFATPGVGLNQQDYATFDFSVSDGSASSNIATVTIDLAAVVDPFVFGNQQGGLQLYSTNFLADSNIAFNAGDGSTMYQVMINHENGTADLTRLGAISTTAFIDHGQIASNLTGTRVYALETQPTEYGFFNTATNTFSTISSTAITPANPQLAGLAYYNDHGTEYLYTISITNETVVAYNNINAINAFASPDFSYGPFTIVDLTGTVGSPSNGLIYDFNGGDLVFDEFGQAYAISDTRVPVAGKDGGFARLDFATNTAYLLNNDTLELVNLTGLIYDPTTHLFYISRSSTVTGTLYEGFVVLNKDGSFHTPSSPAIPYVYNGNNFDHTGGDAASTLQVEYSVPVHLSQIDADGSQAFTSIVIELSTPTVLGAQLYHDGNLVTNGSTFHLLTDSGYVNAHVSISGQTWTLTLDDAGGVTINDDLLSIRTSSSQTADFGATLTATTTELSTGDSITANVSFNYEPTKPVIGEGNMSIVHDETSGIDPGTNDVSTATSPAVFDTLEAANGLSPTPMGQAHTAQGIFEYYVPFGTGFVSNVSLTQQDGSLFNGVDSGLRSENDNPILLYQDANDNMVVGRETNGSGQIYFAVYLDEGNSLYGSANDTLWLAQYKQVLHPDSLDANEPATISDLIYLTVHSTSGDHATSNNPVTVTILDDNDAGPPQLMMMSFFSSSFGDELVSNDDASSGNFMTIPDGDISDLMLATVSNEDSSSTDDASSGASEATGSESPTQDSNTTGSDQALTNEMVFSTENQNNPTQATQQATLDGNTEPQQQVEQQQEQQAQASDPSSAGSPDAISQSMQEADQQSNQQSGSG